MPVYRTPGVYIAETRAFPPSVTEVETAAPAFIGYTEKAQRAAENDLLLKPTPVRSLAEFERCFGGPKAQQVGVTVMPAFRAGKRAVVDGTPALDYLLYHSVRLFFDNGGGKCWIVSVGRYKGAAPWIVPGELDAGLLAVQAEDEPALLAIPEAVRLEYAAYAALARAMLSQCQARGDRFAILDAYHGDLDYERSIVVGGGAMKRIDVANREAWGLDAGHLKYGAAYYPFIKTAFNPAVSANEDNIKVAIKGTAPVSLGALRATQPDAYSAAKAALTRAFLVLPPSGAVAGVYARIDTTRGVWKPPANVPLSSVLEPVVQLDDARQEPLNVDPASGKSVNALRAFAGKGTLVWGARTLAGNDDQWRYVAVRRFFIMVEESVKKSTGWAVFEPNDAGTWTRVRGAIEAYLTQKWRDGALAGTTPREAFFVRCGLGTTMTAQDVLEGRLNVEIGMAVVRPAEFIIFRFSHKTQVS